MLQFNLLLTKLNQINTAVRHKMDIHDFDGLTKYKLYIPLLYIISWICMFIGPAYFPIVYQKLSIGFFIYLTYKIMWIMITMIIIVIRSWSLIDRANVQNAQNQYSSITDIHEEINYGFIIPNYKQQIQLLKQTLEVIASHKRAKTHYMIFLAMQAHEEGSQNKAQQLVHEFRNRFRVIDYTRHQIRPNQQKGKASNVSWCVQHLEYFFQKYMIRPESVMLTIMDADSWAPNVYFDVLEQMIFEEYDERHLRIYQPMQIFTRNNLQVPMFTRIYDIFHSYASMSSLWSYYDLTFPLSNYTFSYNLVKRIGFWDTCADAIAQDLHTTLKALWKTQMKVKCRPIYIPFNQVNISTGNGYFQDLKARFWQAQRHAKGVSQVAYSFKRFFNQPFNLKSLLTFQFIIQLFSVPTVFPWLVISMNFQNHILYRFYKASPQLLSQDSVSFIFALMSIFGTVGYLLYQVVKRRANKIIYKQQNQSIFRLLQYGLFFVIVFFFMSVPTFIIASFSVLFGRQEYVVADKKINVKKQKQIN